MEEVVQYCYICKNRCPLSAPRCDAALSPEMAAERERAAKEAAQICIICNKRCRLDALGCSLGETIHKIKSTPVANR